MRNENLFLNLMGWLMGIEPTTTGITIRDSTTELQPPSENDTAWFGNSGTAP